jgi:hypothetical protein
MYCVTCYAACLKYQSTDMAYTLLEFETESVLLCYWWLHQGIPLYVVQCVYVGEGCRTEVELQWVGPIR